MDHGQGPGAARGSKERQRHCGREDTRSASQKEWSTGKVGVTVASLTFLLVAGLSSLHRGRFLIPDRDHRCRRSRRLLARADVSPRRSRRGIGTAVSRAFDYRTAAARRSSCSVSRLADKVCREDPPRTVCPVSQFSPWRNPRAIEVKRTLAVNGHHRVVLSFSFLLSRRFLR